MSLESSQSEFLTNDSSCSIGGEEGHAVGILLHLSAKTVTGHIGYVRRIRSYLYVVQQHLNSSFHFPSLSARILNVSNNSRNEWNLKVNITSNQIYFFYSVTIAKLINGSFEVEFIQCMRIGKPTNVYNEYLEIVFFELFEVLHNKL